MLVGTVLSQNTNDRNSFAAFSRLTSKFKTAEELAHAKLSEIEELIKIGGLYQEKAKRLKEISKLVLTKYGGDLKSVLEKPIEQAREELLSFPGVGPKTADIMLAFWARHDIIPVDTHIFRVAKRLGFAEERDGYEKVKTKLEQVILPGRRIEAHMLLIQLGRKYCRSRNPLHEKCPINRLCPIGTRYAGLSRPLPRHARSR
ncbi:MAG: endonuclease III domain-containing protein [Candidatus Hadarchaeum sp.]|uniref:endonuclease III domain-containing protein n=1 Tax=Candidatus Hadarchaeum sp. TaxID=2883567 RepID=UPI003D0E3492